MRQRKSGQYCTKGNYVPAVAPHPSASGGSVGRSGGAVQPRGWGENLQVQPAESRCREMLEVPGNQCVGLGGYCDLNKGQVVRVGKVERKRGCRGEPSASFQVAQQDLYVPVHEPEPWSMQHFSILGKDAVIESQATSTGKQRVENPPGRACGSKERGDQHIGVQYEKRSAHGK